MWYIFAGIKFCGLTHPRNLNISRGFTFADCLAISKYHIQVCYKIVCYSHENYCFNDRKSKKSRMNTQLVSVFLLVVCLLVLVSNYMEAVGSFIIYNYIMILSIKITSETWRRIVLVRQVATSSDCWFPCVKYEFLPTFLLSWIINYIQEQISLDFM